MADGKLNDMISTSLEKIRELADAETVVGDPIVTPAGITVIPVSKVSVGYASGGVDYNSKYDRKMAADNPKQNFGGGGGTGISITPVAFLIIGVDGGVSVLPITASSDVGTVDKVASLIERSPDILQRLKDVFAKKDKKKNEDVDDQASDESEEKEDAAETK